MADLDPNQYEPLPLAVANAHDAGQLAEYFNLSLRVMVALDAHGSVPDHIYRLLLEGASATLAEPQPAEDGPRGDVLEAFHRARSAVAADVVRDAQRLARNKHEFANHFSDVCDAQIKILANRLQAISLLRTTVLMPRLSLPLARQVRLLPRLEVRADGSGLVMDWIVPAGSRCDELQPTFVSLPGLEQERVH